MSDSEWVGLDDAITALRRQLDEARERGADEDLRFALGEVTVEFGVEIRKEGASDAGVRLGVVSMGAKGTVAKNVTHKVTIKMTPRTGAGESVDVGDRDD
ncbi:trypco2 family protein [Streptosporangium sp. NPDC048865]|uniref:trypco2 family protein n=1 Tax=Streptosporangium sp. NPDC048865 TaxID=3155766 RepID=UPI003427CC20